MKVSFLNDVVSLIQEASYPVCFSGAGISVPSGIPDFRSPDSGLWEVHDPRDVASIDSFKNHPEQFYEWIRPLVEKTRDAEPNPAHLALTEMQNMGALNEIITQNIDGLHEKAGSNQVLPIHGHTDTTTCLDCGHNTPSESHLEIIQQGKVPRCEKCQGLIKPDVILFGEMLPTDIMNRAYAAAEKTDLVIVVGSSLEVFPANQLPSMCMQNGGKAIIITKGPTPMDATATLKIEDDLAEVLPEIVRNLAN